MAKKRNNFPPEKKVEIIREHLKNKIPVSEICEKYNIHPNMFYKREKLLFEGGAQTFSNSRKNGHGKEASETKKLKDKLQKKDEVISWLTEENIKLKKTFGDL